MEGEVCMYNKFGFSKFKDTCNRQHFSQICDDLSSCKEIQSCLKRHLKVCKRFAAQNEGMFGIDYSYKQKKLAKCLDQNELSDNGENAERIGS